MPESELQALLRISQIDLNQDLDLILKEILTIVTHEIGGTAGTIMLVNEETGELEMVAALGLGNDYIERVYHRNVPITCSPSGVVLKTGTYYEVPNIFDEPRDKWWADLGRELGFSAQLFMPMKREDEIIGLMNVYMPEPHHYTQDEIAFVSIAASHAATIIEKARLYQHVLEKRKELETEIKARQLAEETLTEKERLLNKIFALSPLGIGLVEVDPGGVNDRKLSWTNKAMMALFGFEPDELDYVGQSSEVLYASREEFERVGEQIREKLQKGELAEVDAKLKRRDGSIFDGYITLSFLDPSTPRKGLIATISDVTWRKQAEESLRASEERYRSLIETAGAGVATINMDGEFTLVNDALCTMIGYSQEELLGRFFIDYLHPDDRMKIRDLFLNALKGQRTSALLEFRVFHKDGRTLWWYTNPTPLLLKNEILGFTAIIHDITARKSAEEELQKSETYYRSLIENASDGVMIVNDEGIIQYKSPSSERILGYKSESLVGKSMFEFVHADERVAIKEVFNQLIKKKGFILNLDSQVRHKDGSWRTLNGTASNLLDNSAVRGIVINYRDVTEKKRVEEALRESEEKYRLLIEAANEGIVVAQDGVLKFVNPAVMDAMGYSEEELTSRPFLEFIHPDDRETVAAYHTERLKGAEAPSRYSCRVFAKEGDVVWTDLSSILLTWEGRPATLTFIANITERKKAEDALRAKELEQQILLDSVPVGIFHLDTDSTFIKVNKALAERYGRKTEDFSGKSTQDLFPEEADDYIKSDRELIASGKPQIGVRSRIITPQGERWMRVDKVPLRTVDGTIVGIIGFELDVSAQRNAEEALRESEEKYRTLVENMQDGVFILQGNPPLLVFCNEAFAKMVGYTVAEAMALRFEDYVAPEHLACVRDRYLRRQAGEDVPSEYEYCALHKDGKTRVCVNMNVGLIEYQGKVASLGTVKNVTERRKMEQKLQDSEKRFRSLLQNSTDIIVVLDAQGIVRYITPSVEPVLGYTPEDLFGKKGFVIFHPEDLESAQAAFAKTLTNPGVNVSVVYRALRKDGSQLYLELIGKNLFDDPNISGVVVTARDVTDRKRAENVLRESETKLSQIVQGSSIPSFVIDQNHRITHWNTACERLTGISAAHMVGTKNQWQIFYPQERPVMADFIVDNQPEDVIASMYGSIYRKSDLVEGAYEGVGFFPAFGDFGKWLFFTAAPLKDSKGDVVGALETLLDLTQLKRAEEQIAASLKEKELLLQEIHHRVKNNMQVVSSLLNLQSRRVKDKGALEMFMDAQSRVKSMALVHEKLYQSGDIARIDFAEYIRSLTSNLFDCYLEPAKNIKLTIDAQGVFMDINTAIPCGLVINELVSNVLKHAFPDGRKGELTISMHQLDGDEIELTVSDTGIGFSEAVDFRNTESLGMQLVISLVEGQLDGIVKLNRDGGTTFTIVFRRQA